MSENSGNLTAPGENNKVGPDFFGFYASEVAELLSQDPDLLPFSHQNPHVGREKEISKNSCRTKENNGNSGSASLFSDGIGALLSDFKKERFKSLLRDSVFTLTKEVDEMVDPILSVCRIRSCLRSKERLLREDATASSGDQAQQHPHKKCKISPGRLDSKNGSVLNSDNAASEDIELDDDLRFLLENDTTKVEELMNKHVGELFDTLQHMEQKLEELLNSGMTSCRSMTHSEKQQLRKAILELPPKNLDRVVEIIQQNKPSEKYSSNEVHVDLEQQDNVTLWRLYFYVKAI